MRRASRSSPPPRAPIIGIWISRRSRAPGAAAASSARSFWTTSPAPTNATRIFPIFFWTRRSARRSPARKTHGGASWRTRRFAASPRRAFPPRFRITTACAASSFPRTFCRRSATSSARILIRGTIWTACSIRIGNNWHTKSSFRTEAAFCMRKFARRGCF